MDDLRALFSLHGPVEELQFDDEFQEHMTERATYRKHQVTMAEITEAHARAPKYWSNIGTGRAPIIMVGLTEQGRWLCVPVEPTGRFGVWRPVTAFEANTHHQERYWRG